jgi:hypothetical protein
MKRPHLQFILAFALLGGGAFAQSSRAVPGPADYAAFSQFIAERNIFDPNRQPHYPSSRRTYSRPRAHSASAPAFTLVGVMSYEKGAFAFFNGNSEELKQVLPVTGGIAGYTVAEIAPGRVVLEATNRTDRLELKIGDGLREENGKWQPAGAGEIELADGGSTTNSAAAAAGSASTAPAVESNDILKRLMERRAQENQ